MQNRFDVATVLDLRKATKGRNLNSSKRDSGTVVVIGGGRYYHGAPALASNAAHTMLAALRTGAGYTVSYVPKSVATAVRSVSPNVIVKTFSKDSLMASDLRSIKEGTIRAGSVVVGPGLGNESKTAGAIIGLIKMLSKRGTKTVIDADALGPVSRLNCKLGRNFIITPNEKEFRNFYKGRLTMNTKNRAHAAVAVSQKLGAVVLLKGHSTIVTDGTRVKVINSNTAALATMGSGDVLSGIIGAYACWNDDLFLAAVAGAFLNAKVGDHLYSKMGNHAIASDIYGEIPNWLKRHGL
jgi:NAD(P)H-hydrate epimerase